MKKLVFFIPAIIFTIFYGLVALVGMGAIHPIVLLWLALLWIAGVFLSKSMFWGGFLGFTPGACFIYMSTKDTGQIFPIEMPLGIVIVVFYLSCCVFVFYKKKKVQK